MSTIGLADRIDLTRRGGPPSHKEWTASLHSGHLALPAGNPGSERAFKEWCGNQQRADAEDKQEDQIGLDGRESTVLQKNCLESVNGVGKGIDDGDGPEPLWKCGDWVNGA